MLFSARTGSIFNQALRLPPHQRPQFLVRACGGDTGLIRELESLLSSAEDSGTYFEKLSHRLNSLDTNPKQTQFPGLKQVGPWNLLSLLGRGGMGSVYLAERADHQYTKQVALKILPLGADDPISRYRFTSERQILAQLNHENIARLIDGGVTECGTPYFVMDYVKGLSIDKYYRTKKLTLKEKLALFLKVCNAVQYAHNHLVVHRDLKPSNVLVDENGNVKLLDFGIAKILATNKPYIELTQAASCPLTLGYASPEMLKGEPVDITTDVYSLGVVLYELLTDHKPYEVCKSAADFRLAHRSARPPKPSTVTGDRKTGKDIQGDVDTILLKAINPEPGARYSSVEHFADDIKHYLKGFPIEARPYSSLYHFGKFIRRHQTATLVASSVIVVLCLSTFFSARQMYEAQQQRDLAQYQQRRVQASNDFLNLLLAEIGPEGEALTLEELLDHGVSMLDKQFQSKPGFVGHMFFELSHSYNLLGNKNKMAELLQKAENIARRKNDWDLLSTIICTQADQSFRVDPDFARNQYKTAMLAQSKLPAPSINSAVICNRAYARLLESEGDLYSALEVIENTLTMLNNVNPFAGDLHLSLINRKTLIFYSLGRQAELLKSNSEALSLLETSGRGATIVYLLATQNRAVLLDMMGEIVDSVSVRRRVLERFKTFNGKKQLPEKFIARYADGLLRLNKYDEALKLYQENIEKVRSKGDKLLVAHHHLSIGKILSYQGKYVEAGKNILAAEKEYEKSPISNQRQLNRIALARVILLRQQGYLDSALQSAIRLLKSMGYPDKKRGFLLSQVLCEAATISLKLNSETSIVEQYIEDFMQTATLLARSIYKSADAGRAYVLRAKMHVRFGRFSEAYNDLIIAVKALSNSVGIDHPHTQEAAQLLSVVNKAAHTVSGKR